MTDRELEIFLAKLIDRRGAFLAEGDLKLDPNRKDPASLPDEDEQPLNEMHQVIASRRNRTRAKEIAGIEAAIRAIRENPDDYGLCESCDEPIPPKRLELMPWAKLCVRCKSQNDEGQRGYKRGHAGDFLE